MTNEKRKNPQSLSLSPIIFIHGVQPETDASGFSSQMQKQIATLCGMTGIKTPWMGELVWSDLLDMSGSLGALDVISDVLRYDKEETRSTVVDTSMERFGDLCKRAKGADGLVVFAHSLGTVLALDMMRALGSVIGTRLVTIGSPLGVDVPALPGIAYLDRRSIDTRALRWVDFWCPGDPVATGVLFGRPVASGSRGLQDAGYRCQSIEMRLGTNPIGAHSAYWDQRQIAQVTLALAGENA